MDIGGGESTAVDRAFDGFAGALDRLIEVVEAGGLDGFDGVALVGFLQRFEQTRNRMSLVDHRAVRVAEIDPAGADGRAAEPDRHPRPGYCASPAAEAARRVRAAEHVGERVAMTGEALGTVAAALAAAQRAGDVSPEQVDICARALEGVDRRGFDPADLDAGDRLLAEFTPDVRAEAAARDSPSRSSTGSTPTAPSRTSSSTPNVATSRSASSPTACTPSKAASPASSAPSSHAVLGPLAKPRVETVVLDDGRTVDEPDPRHHGQRTHDALGEVCDRLLRSGTLPDSGGTPATVIVTITEDDLQAQRPLGRTSDGTMLSTERSSGSPTRPTRTRRPHQPASSCSSAGPAAGQPSVRPSP